MAAATVTKLRHGRRPRRDAPEPAEDLMPSAEQTRQEGNLEKRVLTTAGSTVWQPRLGILSDDFLFFSNVHAREDVYDHIPLIEVAAVEVEHVDSSHGVAASFVRLPSFNNESPKNEDAPHGELAPCFVIRTTPGGYNAGRSYTLKCPSDEDAQGWVQAVRQARKDALARKRSAEIFEEHGHNQLAFIRAHARVLSESDRYSYAQAVLILMAFAVDLTEAQLLPPEGSHLEAIFMTMNTVLAVVFALELSVSLFSKTDNLYKEFFSDMGSMFDLAVVVICVVQAVLQYIDNTLPPVKMLRLIRVVRVVSLFKEFVVLSRIVRSIQAALFPVMNAFFIFLVVTCVYASIGTHLFADVSPHFFGNLSRSFFTLIQAGSGDAWGSVLARDLNMAFSLKGGEHGLEAVHEAPMDWRASLYFISFYFVATVVLLNVCVAVLLDEFIQCLMQDKEDAARHEVVRALVLVVVVAVTHSN